MIVNVSLGAPGNFDIVPSRYVVDAGIVTFKVVNADAFAITHEFLLIKTTDSAADIIAAAPLGGQFDESGYDVRVDSGNVVQHGTYTATVTLEVGHYVAVCNEAGHAHLGMAVNMLVVTQGGNIMRSQIFRTPPILVEDANQVVLLKDMDGADPFELYVENVDTAASLRTKYGSKNANLRFVAVTPGEDGNDIEVIIEDISGGIDEATVPKSQTFAVDVTGSVITVTLATDAGGRPSMTADEVAAALNADVDVAALVRVVRALGSDGSAIFGVVAETDPAEAGAGFDENLEGGFDAVALGDVDFYRSPTGWPDFAGPWEEIVDGDAYNSLDGLIGVKGVAFVDAPMRGLKVTASAGSGPTTIVVTAIIRKK